MPVPNLPSLTTRISRGAEGGHEFARLVGLLLTAEFSYEGPNLVLADDSAGDYRGADATLRTWDRTAETVKIFGFQFKFFPSPLSTAHRRKLKDSYRHATEEQPELSKWIAVTPDDLNRHDMTWFESLARDLSASSREARPNPPVEHWGNSRLMDLLLKHPHIGSRYYPELQRGADIGVLTLDRIRTDTRQSAWTLAQDEDDLVGPMCPEQCIDREEPFSYQGLPAERRAAYDAALSLLKSADPSGPIQAFDVNRFADTLWIRMRSRPGRRDNEEHRAEIDVVNEAIAEQWPGQSVLETNAALARDREALLLFHQWFGRSPDPILDLVVTNRTSTVQCVYAVGMEILKCWEELGPSPVAASAVPTLAQAVLHVANRPGKQLVVLDDPIQLPPQTAARVSLRLADYETAFPSTYTTIMSILIDTSAGIVSSRTVCCYYPPPP